jgi:hypothetical protein
MQVSFIPDLMYEADQARNYLQINDERWLLVSLPFQPQF